MRRTKKNLWKHALPVMGALCLAAGIPVSAEEAETEEIWEMSESEMEEILDQALGSYSAPETFIEGDFYGEVINDENDALAAAMSVIDRLGGDEDTVLSPLSIRPNVNDMTVYTFHQLEGDTAVYGATVKVITDKDKHVCALSSSLAQGIDAEPLDEWGITGEEAEKIVLDKTADRKLRIVEGATEQTLLPFVDDTNNFYYAWIVYTNNDDPGVDTAYLAHYVDEQGEYLFSLPVLQPGDTDALSGEGASLLFLSFEEDTWSGTVTKHDGTTKELTVPVLKDKETGERFLGDLKRKVACIDYADFTFNDTITMRKEEDGRFADNELLIYDTFLRVYDMYEGAGWTGPDGEGTPVLLQMDYVDEEGDPIQNAAYVGMKKGYQTFEFNRIDPDGECTDIIAHEFTHCVTQKLMTYNLYYNIYGAVNEAFSDICGNIIEAAYGDSEDETWMIQENGIETLRSMSDPGQFDQPAFVWDVHYLPVLDTVSFDLNDLGGVHINSSLLNLIGYRLNQSGMPLDEQLYFWMNVALVMTPKSDYDDLMEIMSWVANQLGYSDYVPALEAAFEETGIVDLSLPETVGEGYGRIQFVLPFSDTDATHYVRIEFANLDDESVYSTAPEAGDYMVAATLPVGRYITTMTFYDEEIQTTGIAVLGDDGWKSVDQEGLQEMLMSGEGIAICNLESGDISVVATENQEALLEEMEIE